MHRLFLPLFLLTIWLLGAVAGAQVVINEVQYHPVEKAHFDANGISVFNDTGLPGDVSKSQMVIKKSGRKGLRMGCRG